MEGNLCRCTGYHNIVKAILKAPENNARERRRLMYPFRYCRPTSLGDAVRMFAASDDATFLSGGHTLLPTLKARLAAPSDVIDLSALPELRGIEESEGGLLIRGGTVMPTSPPRRWCAG